LNPPQREKLDVIRQSGAALLRILNDILDLSKIEAGKVEFEEIDFDLGEIVRGAEADFSTLAHQKGLTVAFDMAGAYGVYRGDPTRLRQILYNLASNAVKFTDKGGVRIGAAYADSWLTLTVTDSGIGMDADGVAKLFAKFSQVDASTTRRFGGTGLGLAICRELAEQMGGSITVTSIPGEGSAFTVTLPLPRIGEALDIAPSTDAAPTEIAEEVRVLAAEDNAVNQLVLKTLLSQVGVSPVVVNDGVKAVQAWEEEEWDVILMDIRMPRMDGAEATQVIREREAATGRKRTPIIGLTADAMSYQVAEYLACGMDGHVAKPIEAAKLFEALGAVLDHDDVQAA
jgi:CheY-like chemotaxis protein